MKLETFFQYHFSWSLSSVRFDSHSFNSYLFYLRWFLRLLFFSIPSFLIFFLSNLIIVFIAIFTDCRFVRLNRVYEVHLRLLSPPAPILLSLFIFGFILHHFVIFYSHFMRFFSRFENITEYLNFFLSLLNLVFFQGIFLLNYINWFNSPILLINQVFSLLV